MVGVAVKVTELPLQIDVVLAVMVTEGVTDVAVIVIGLLIAVVGLAQGILLVITTETISPLTNVVVVNADAVCPVTLVPFIFH